MSYFTTRDALLEALARQQDNLNEAEQFATIQRDYWQQRSSENIDKMNQQLEAREIFDGLNGEG